MKIFLDTEFIEDGKTIDLLSLALVAEDGRELYVVNTDAKLEQANEWVKLNVIPQLYKNIEPITIHATSHNKIKDFVLDFVGNTRPEFWGYYADYDWVVFCQLFGPMITLPKNFPMYCNDIKQLCKSLGNPNLRQPVKDEHHALADARWNKTSFEFLQTLKA